VARFNYEGGKVAREYYALENKQALENGRRWRMVGAALYLIYFSSLFMVENYIL
jgi:hypothetical protein